MSESDKKKKFLKQGKVVIVLNGRFAGRKGIIVKAFDENQNDRSYGHCLIAGIDRYPLKVTKDMKSKRFNKRSKVKPFVRMVNYNHIMPTRYSLDVDLKDANKLVVGESYTNTNLRQEVKKTIKKQLEERYKTGKNTWFFKKLRF